MPNPPSPMRHRFTPGARALAGSLMPIIGATFCLNWLMQLLVL
ncbi:hypothetical protein LINPERHAP2_LOCUS16923 [Linum perenne]